MEMVMVTIRRNFVTGNLQGLTVPISFSYPASVAADRVAALEASREEVQKDFFGSGTYRILGIETALFSFWQPGLCHGKNWR